jgi:hypothetical protein
MPGIAKAQSQVAWKKYTGELTAPVADARCRLHVSLLTVAWPTWSISPFSPPTTASVWRETGSGPKCGRSRLTSIASAIEAANKL